MHHNKRLLFLVLEPEGEVADLYHYNFNRYLNAGTYRSSIENIQTIAEDDFDCIVTDIPFGWTADKLIQDLRLRWNHSPILVATGRAGHILTYASHHKGVCVIMKPFNMEEMVELLEVILELKTTKDSKAPGKMHSRELN